MKFKLKGKGEFVCQLVTGRRLRLFAVLPLFTEMRRSKTSNVVAVSLPEALMANRSEDFSQWRTTVSSHLANNFIHSIFVANGCPYMAVIARVGGRVFA